MSHQTSPPPPPVVVASATTTTTTSSPPPAANSRKSPDDDVSPKTQVPPAASPRTGDYFSAKRAGDNGATDGTNGTFKAPSFASNVKSDQMVDQSLKQRSSVSNPISPTTVSPTMGSPTPVMSPAGNEDESDSRKSSSASGSVDCPEMNSRKSSVASVTFRPPRNPSLPQGHQRKTDAQRLRASSPSPVRFRHHVAFDNLPAGEATKNNTSSFTLNVRHQGYQPQRRSRTFMVGVDEHAYSDYALVWLLENLVDDGDEVVCVRVVENPVRSGEKNYQEDAKKLLQTIQGKNTANRAISIVLEYSVGKLHSTFQQLIQIYQPSMLIVGTRGRSLGGIQGLVNTRNSFSKYCLQYSPVPVVVVRPDEKRKKKKDKRSHDPSRQSYIGMLASNQGRHEADSENSSLYDLEVRLSPDEEAHRVAAALGLPAAFDPTIKPYDAVQHPNPRGSTSSVGGGSAASTASASDSTTPRRRSSPPPSNRDNDSGDEESNEEDEEDFEVMSSRQALKDQKAQQAIQAQKARLHLMEVGEAAALLKSGAGRIDEDEEEGEEGSQGSGNGGTKR